HSKYPHSLTSTATTVTIGLRAKPPLSNAAKGFAHVAANRLRRGELRHHFIIDVEVRRYALHVVVIFELLHHLQHLLGRTSRDLDGILGHHRDLSPRHHDTGLFDRVAHRLKPLRGGHHLIALVLGDNVVGARLERQFDQLILVRGIFFDGDHAALLEHPGDRSGFTEVAAVTRQHVAQLGHGAIAIVGEDIDYHRDTACAVALIHYLFKLAAAEF